MPFIDEFSLEELRMIKENIPIIAEYKGAFSKFIDSLHYYKEYPIVGF